MGVYTPMIEEQSQTVIRRESLLYIKHPPAYFVVFL